MNFSEGISQGFIRKVPPDNLRAKSLIQASHEALFSVAKLSVEPPTSKTIIRELYESMRQYIEAIGSQKGYKFSIHEALTPFLEEILKEQRIAIRFDRYRKLRNGVNYYGDDISLETIQEALREIPKIIQQLEKHLNQ